MGFELWIQLAPVVILLILGFSIGTLVERAHFKRLVTREQAVRGVLVTNMRSPPKCTSVQTLGLVGGEVVIASDYFKTFLAAIRKLVGGELHTFETLMVRARWEALVRMLETAQRMGANCVINVRFDTSNIGGARRKRAAAMVEMLVSGTAIRLSETPSG